MYKRLGSLRNSGIRFGFLFTLTHENIGDLEWVVEFAARRIVRIGSPQNVQSEQSFKGQNSTYRCTTGHRELPNTTIAMTRSARF